jgi:hypothetical protein
VNHGYFYRMPIYEFLYYSTTEPAGYYLGLHLNQGFVLVPRGSCDTLVTSVLDRTAFHYLWKSALVYVSFMKLCSDLRNSDNIIRTTMISSSECSLGIRRIKRFLSFHESRYFLL